MLTFTPAIDRSGAFGDLIPTTKAIHWSRIIFSVGAPLAIGVVAVLSLRWARQQHTPEATLTFKKFQWKGALSRALIVIAIAWALGCISTKTDPSKIFQLFSYPLAIAHITFQGLGSLLAVFVVVGPVVHVYGRFRKASQSFVTYLAWTTILAAVALIGF